MMYNNYTYDEEGNIDGELNIELQVLESGKILTLLSYTEGKIDIDMVVDKILEKQYIKSS